jgi:hypothetical protein
MPVIVQSIDILNGREDSPSNNFLSISKAKLKCPTSRQCPFKRAGDNGIFLLNIVMAKSGKASPDFSQVLKANTLLVELDGANRFIFYESVKDLRVPIS